MAGKPAKFTGTVKISFKYISTGFSLIFEFKGKAGVGVVGVRITSIPLEKTALKSSSIKLLTFNAF